MICTVKPPRQQKQTQVKAVLRTGFKRGLSLHPRPMHKTRKTSNAENCHLSVGWTGVARFRSETF